MQRGGDEPKPERVDDFDHRELLYVYTIEAICDVRVLDNFVYSWKQLRTLVEALYIVIRCFQIKDGSSSKYVLTRVPGQSGTNDPQFRHSAQATNPVRD